MGRDYIGHAYLGHAFVGHDYMDHSYIGQADKNGITPGIKYGQ